jgi:hypothetical protein
MRAILLAIATIVLAGGLCAQFFESEPNDTFAEADDFGILTDQIWAKAQQSGFDRDFFQFQTLAFYDAIVVRTSTGNPNPFGDINSTLGLYNSGLVLLDTNDDYIGFHSGIVYFNANPDTYYAEEFAPFPNAGGYDLTIFAHKFIYERTDKNLGTLPKNGFMLKGYLDPGETDTYSFEIPAAPGLVENLGIWMTSDIDLKFEANGILSNDEGPGLNPGIEVLNPSAGVWKVEISGNDPFQEGEYIFFVEGVPIPEPALLSLAGLALYPMLRRKQPRD